MILEIVIINAIYKNIYTREMYEDHFFFHLLEQFK